MNRATQASPGPSPEYSSRGLFALLGNIREDLVKMLHSEVDLLRTELHEKVSKLGRQGIIVAVGAVVAYTGAVVFMIGICFLIAFALQQAGLSETMATWIAFLSFGLLVTLAGAIALKKGLEGLKKTSVAPKQTLASVKEIAGRFQESKETIANPDSKDEQAEKTRRARNRAEEKIAKVQSELAEVQARMTPHYLWAATRTAMQRRPQLSAGIGVSALAVGYLMIKNHHSRRKLKRNAAYRLVVE